MSEPIDQLPLGVKESEPWDRAAAPPEVPMSAQEEAIEHLLEEETLPLPLPGPPVDLLAELAAAAPSQPAATPTQTNVVEEFKPTDEDWANIKEQEFPHTSPHAFKPELIERDAQGRDGGGDWIQVEPEKPEDANP